MMALRDKIVESIQMGLNPGRRDPIAKHEAEAVADYILAIDPIGQIIKAYNELRLELAHTKDQLQVTYDRGFVDGSAEARSALERMKDAYSKTADEVEQTLGKALGYPWFKDDQKNFPGATEADGVCVGEHVPESIASEAANRIKALERRLNESPHNESTGD